MQRSTSSHAVSSVAWFPTEMNTGLTFARVRSAALLGVYPAGRTRVVAKQQDR